MGGVCRRCGRTPPRHAPDCPSETELWPVEARDLKVGLACMDCGEPFGAGEFYTRRPAPLGKWLGPDSALPGVPVVEVVCLGCAAVSAAVGSVG